MSEKLNQQLEQQDLEAMADQLLAEDAAKREEEDSKSRKKLDDKTIAALPAATLITANEKLKDLLAKGCKTGKLDPGELSDVVDTMDLDGDQMDRIYDSLADLGIEVDSIRLGGRLLAALGASIVFYSLSTLSNSILQAVGKASKPVTNAVIALAVQTVVAAALLIFTDLGIYSLPIAVTVYSFMMCLLNGIAVKKATGYHQEIEKTFVLPLVSSAIMGLVVAGIYYGLTLTVLKGYLGNAVALLLSVAIGGLTYFAAALKLGVMSKKELLGIPGGSMIVKFAVKLHLLKN